jgi:hypothetical protein
LERKKTPLEGGVTRVIVVVANSVSVEAALLWWLLFFLSLRFFLLLLVLFSSCSTGVFWLRCPVTDVEHCHRWQKPFLCASVLEQGTCQNHATVWK